MLYKLKKLSTNEEIETWKCKLEQFLPQSRSVLQGINMMQTFKLDEHPSFNMAVHVPDESDPPFFIVFTPACSSPKFNSVILFWDYQSLTQEQIKGYTNCIIQWDRNKPLAFYASYSDLKEQMKEAFHNDTLRTDFGQIDVLSTGIQLVCDKLPDDDAVLPSGFEIRPLSNSSVDFVFSKWTFNWTEDIDCMKAYIDILPSAAIYKANEKYPVSWSVLYPNGNIGQTYTLAEYRKRGFSKIVNRFLHHEISMQGLLCTLVVERSNLASLKFHRNIGYKDYASLALWFYLPTGWKMEDLFS